MIRGESEGAQANLLEVRVVEDVRDQNIDSPEYHGPHESSHRHQAENQPENDAKDLFEPVKGVQELVLRAVREEKLAERVSDEQR